MYIYERIALSIHKNYDNIKKVIRMNKKFKELRMLIVCLIMFCVFVGLAIFNAFQDNKGPVIGLVLLSLIALFLLISRYKMVLFDDMMMIYEWKVAAMLPTMIEYRDIKNIQKISQHHVLIEHLHKSHVYVLNSDKFILAYEQLKKNETKENVENENA